MPWAWGDAIDAGTDWSSLSFLNKFVDALNERYNALRSPAVVPTIASFASGDDAQAATRVSQMQVFVETIIGGSDEYTDPAGAYDGAATWPTPFDFASLRTVCSLSTAGWRRKRPREIANTAAAADAMGNTAANGQVAWLTAAPYGLYKRTAGAWGPAVPSDVPDTLDTLSAAPNTIPLATPDDSYCAHGDYIGPWLWLELRAMLNKLVWTTWPITPSSGDFTANDASAAPATFAVWADAKADADAEWALDVEGGGLDAHAYSYGNYDGVVFNATVDRGKVDLGLLGVPIGVSRSREWYVKAGVAALAGSGAFTNFNTAFDANGDGVADGLYKLTHTDAADAAATTITYTFPRASLTTNQPTWVAEPASDTESYLGYAATDYQVVIKWDGAGGFQFRA